MSNTQTNDCILKYIKMTNQEIPETMFDELIFNLYNNFVFSTFPYIVYKENSSISALNKYNSGNCIALSTFTCI